MSEQEAQQAIERLVAAFCADLLALAQHTIAEALRHVPDAPAETAADVRRPKRARPPRVRSRRPEGSPSEHVAQPVATESAPPSSEPASPATPTLADRVRDVVVAHAAYSARDIAEALGARTVDVITPLRELVEQQRVHKRIEYGTVRYYADPPPADDDDDD